MQRGGTAVAPVQSTGTPGAPPANFDRREGPPRKQVAAGTSTPS